LTPRPRATDERLVAELGDSRTCQDPCSGVADHLSAAVISVGGTSLAKGKHENYEFETAWGTILDPLTVNSGGTSSWAFAPTDTKDEIENYLYTDRATAAWPTPTLWLTLT
jgi:hypothetical protein